MLNYSNPQRNQPRIFLTPHSPDALMGSGSRPPTYRQSERRDSTFMAYVYILESLRDGRYYIGSTENLKQRLQHHSRGATPTTRRFGKIQLAFAQKYPTLHDARIVERKLKKLRRKDYIRKIIVQQFIKIQP